MKSVLAACIILFASATSADQALITQTDNQARPESHALIDKMLNSVEQVNYQGTFVFKRGGKLHSMQIVHGTVNGEVKERLNSLNGEPCEIVRDSRNVTGIWPDRSLVTLDRSSVSHGIPTIIPRELESLKQNYHIITGPMHRVAGYECRVLKIRPYDYFRYGYELCIEPKHGMLLHSKMYHPRGRLLEEVMFTNVQYLNSVDHIDFQPENDIEEYTWKSSKQLEYDSHVILYKNNAWQVSHLPPGFTVSDVSQEYMTTSDEPVQHMVVSDGVASVSVFIAKPRQSSHLYEGSSQRGSINAFLREFNDHQITVLGEVPDETVKMIGSSIVYKK